MIVCVCKRVNDRQLDQMVASGLSTVGEVGRACGAGTDCGTCCRDIRARLRLRSSDSAVPVVTEYAAK